MARAPARAPAPADEPATLPSDLPTLKLAPQRLRNAEVRHERAKEALRDAVHRHAALSRQLSTAREEEATAQAAAEREQSRPQAYEGRVNIQTFGSPDQNPANIGPQLAGVQGAFEEQRPDAPELRKYAAVKEAVMALRSLLDTAAARLPEHRADLEEATEELTEAARDVVRLEAVKAAHALPDLIDADAGFIAAADALEKARLASVVTRDRLTQQFGFDARFAPKLLLTSISAGVATLVDPTKRWRDDPADLLQTHRDAFEED